MYFWLFITTGIFLYYLFKFVKQRRETKTSAPELTREQLMRLRDQRYSSLTTTTSPSTTSPPRKETVDRNVEDQKQVGGNETKISDNKTTSPVMSREEVTKLRETKYSGESSPPQPVKRVVEQQSPPQEEKKKVTKEELEHMYITQIFKVETLQTRKSSSRRFLSNLSNDLSEYWKTKGLEGESFISVDFLDTLLFERLDNVKPYDAMMYLMDCYASINTKNEKDDNKIRILERCKKAITTMSVLLFQREGIKEGEVLSIINDLPFTHKITFFSNLSSFVETSEELEELTNIFSSIFNSLQETAKTQVPTKSLTTLTSLLANDRLTNFLCNEFAGWRGIVTNGRQVQTNTFLGNLFSWGYFEGDNKELFGDSLEKMTREEMSLIVNQAREMINNVQKQQLTVLYLLTKKNDKNVKKVFREWIYEVLNYNKIRTQTQFNIHLASSDSFVLNVSYSLLKLNLSFAKSDSLKGLTASFWYEGTCFNFRDETPVHQTEEVKKLISESSELRESLSEDILTTSYDFNESFVTSIYSLHVGYMSSVKMYQRLYSELAKLHKHIQRLKVERTQWAQHQIQANEIFLKTLETRLQSMMIAKSCMDVHLFNPTTTDLINNAYMFFIDWCTLQLNPTNLPIHQLLQKLENSTTNTNENSGGESLNNSLNLSSASPYVVPVSFCCIPEFIFEDFVDYFRFVVAFGEHAPDHSTYNKILTFITLILKLGNNGVKNPYLRTKFSGLFFHFSSACQFLPPEMKDQMSSNYHQMEEHAIAQIHLIPSLMRLFVDVEICSSEETNVNFYAKFNIRKEILDLLTYLRSISRFFPSLKKASENEKLFTKFINNLLGDANYMLGEFLKNLQEISVIEALMNDNERWNQLSNEEREEKSQHHRSFGDMALTYSTFSDCMVDCIDYLTRDLSDSFTKDLISDHIATTLNYFLVILAGPEQQKLKTKDPKKYKFNPKLFLTKICQCYLNMSHQKKFMASVANDVRSFKKEIFLNAIRILSEKKLWDNNKIFSFKNFLEQVEMMQGQQTEEYEDVPDHFLDPLLDSLMTDPVILPTSGNTCDRKVIERHLLSDQTDPFNRKPLTRDQLIPNVELKKEIEEWKKSKK